MAAGDINDPLSNIPNIALVDQSAASAAPGAGYARLETVNGVLGLRVGTGAWVPLVSLVAGLLTPLDEKVTPADTDLVLLQDEEDASALKKVQVSNLPGGGEATIPDPVDWSGTLTLAQSATVTKTVNYATYTKLGKLVTVNVALTATSAGTGNQNIVVGGLPAGAAIANYSTFWCLGIALIEKAGGRRYMAMVTSAGGDSFMFFDGTAGAAFGQVPAFTLGNGDMISFSATYDTT